MNKEEIVSKVKFRLLEKYTVKNLLPSEDIINDCIDSTLKAINYAHSSTQLPTKEERDLELSKRVEDIKQHSSMGANKQMVLAYRIGFEECDDWLRKR